MTELDLKFITHLRANLALTSLILYVNLLTIDILFWKLRGIKRDQDYEKENAVQEWVNAVNYSGNYGSWYFLEIRDVKDLPESLEKLFS